MTATTFARSLVRRWQGPRPRPKVTLALLVVAALVGAWFLAWGLHDPWPARATLQTPRDNWPLGFSPDGRTFLTSIGGGIAHWNVATGQPEGEPWKLRADVSATTGAFSPDGRAFAVVTHGLGGVSILVIDVSTGQIRVSWPLALPTVFALRFSADGRTLKTFLGKNRDLEEMVSWDVETGREVARRTVSTPSKTAIACVSPDGKTLALASVRQLVVELWDLDADRSLGSVMDPKTTSAVSWGSLAISLDNRTLAVGRESGAIEVWDLATRQLLRVLNGHSPGYASSWLRFSDDGRSLASEGLLLRDTPIGQILGDLRFRLGLRRSGDDRPTEVIVLDLPTGRRLARCVGSIHPEFSPDGRTIATRERALNVKLRDVPERAKWAADPDRGSGVNAPSPPAGRSP